MFIPLLLWFSIVLFFFLAPSQKEEPKKTAEQELADAIAKYISQATQSANP